MNKDKQRIAIAEACGWSRLKLLTTGLRGVRPSDKTTATAPNYLNDLNAMHEAEDALDLIQRRKFRNILSKHRTPKCAAIHATAEERAEAFLRTIGKWEDEQ